jgi:ABC-type nitrate/sulfonate/bicarbonate transport system substrate-binding protein
MRTAQSHLAARAAMRNDNALKIGFFGANCSGKFRIVAPAYSAIAPRFLISAYVTTKGWASAHPDVVARFARVVDEAARFANSHHTETAPYVAQFSGLPLPVVQKMPRAIFTPRLDRAELQPEIDIAAKYGMLAHRFDVRELIFNATENR